MPIQVSTASWVLNGLRACSCAHAALRMQLCAYSCAHAAVPMQLCACGADNHLVEPHDNDRMENLSRRLFVGTRIVLIASGLMPPLNRKP